MTSDLHEHANWHKHKWRRHARGFIIIQSRSLSTVKVCGVAGIMNRIIDCGEIRAADGRA